MVRDRRRKCEPSPDGVPLMISSQCRTFSPKTSQVRTFWTVEQNKVVLGHLDIFTFLQGSEWAVQANEWLVWANEWIDSKWPSTYVPILGCSEPLCSDEDELRNESKKGRVTGTVLVTNRKSRFFQFYVIYTIIETIIHFMFFANLRVRKNGAVFRDSFKSSVLK